MRKYFITVVRTHYELALVEVEAENKDEAHDAAIDKAKKDGIGEDAKLFWQAGTTDIDAQTVVTDRGAKA